MMASDWLRATTLMIFPRLGSKRYCKLLLLFYQIISQLFEKKIFDKTKKRDDEILLLDGYTITYKTNVDLMFYVIGSAEENELLLAK